VREGKIDEVFGHLMRIHSYWSSMLRQYADPTFPAAEGTLEFHELDGGIADENGSPTGSELAGTPVPDVTFGVTNLTQILKQERGGIEGIIRSHYPEFMNRDRSITCDCDREFADEENWAKHLRIRIEKYLLDEFSPHGD